jgi:ubiquitin C-terminal hydrolase
MLSVKGYKSVQESLQD